MQEQMSVWTGYTGAPCKELRRLQAGACGKRECQLEKGNMCGSKDLSQAEMRIIMSFTFLNQLPSPAEIKRDFPLSEELKQLKKEKIKMRRL